MANRQNVISFSLTPAEYAALEAEAAAHGYRSASTWAKGITRAHLNLYASMSPEERAAAAHAATNVIRRVEENLKRFVRDNIEALTEDV
jgi:hypothetical protein